MIIINFRFIMVTFIFKKMLINSAEFSLNKSFNANFFFINRCYRCFGIKMNQFRVFLTTFYF